MRLLWRLELFAATVFLTACSDGSEPESDACPQTYEFGNFGCARIQGVVRDAAGAPVAGARVTLRPPEGSPNTYDSPMDETDASGAYSMEIHDYGGPAPSPDPVPMHLHAGILSNEVGAPPTARDSLLVNLKFAPVGEVPEVVLADISLDIP